MKQIIALGGGGFSMEPDNLALDQYILEQTKKAKPSICFLPTASGESENYVTRFYTAFEKFECKPSHLSLFRLPTTDLKSYLLSQDVIYVGGGNTRSMLAVWQEWGLNNILFEAWKSGVILTGLSAGGMCWFKQGVTDSLPGILSPMDCLGFLPGSFCPHYDGEADRKPTFKTLVSEGIVIPGYGVDDGAALHFIDQKLEYVVSSRKTAGAYKVENTVEGLSEQPLETKILKEC